MQIHVEADAVLNPHSPKLSIDDIEFALKTLSTMVKAEREKNLLQSPSDKLPKDILRERARMLAEMSRHTTKGKGKKKFH